MTVSHHDSRPPPYAALRATSDAASAITGQPASNGPAQPTAADAAYWRQEAEKLDVLLQTLWSGFLDAGSNGLPTALADYVTAYTGAMRLRLTLMGYTAVPNRALKIAPHAPPRAKQP